MAGVEAVLAELKASASWQGGPHLMGKIRRAEDVLRWMRDDMLALRDMEQAALEQVAIEQAKVRQLTAALSACVESVVEHRGAPPNDDLSTYTLSADIPHVLDRARATLAEVTR